MLRENRIPAVRRPMRSLVPGFVSRRAVDLDSSCEGAPIGRLIDDLARRELHVERIALFDWVADRYVFENLSYLSRCVQCNWLKSIELGIVPIHFRESKDFIRQECWRLLRLPDMDAKHLWGIHARICLKEVNTPPGVKQMLGGVERHHSAAQRRV